MKRIIASLGVVILLILLAAASLVCLGLNDRPGKADLALVLGNTVRPDGSLSPRLKARMDTCLTQYKAGYFKLILVSGGTGKEGYPEGTAMKNYLVQNRIPEDRILVDNQGIDTFASARHTKAVLAALDLKSVFVITQYFHIPRSRMALAKLGISPIFNASPSYFELRDVYSTMRELPACLKYFFRKMETGERPDLPASTKTP